jgi:DNA ligase-1
MDSEFSQFAEVGEAIGQTPAKLEKVRILAQYLRSLTAEQLPIAATYLTGRAFPQNDLRTLQVGWAVIVRALQAASRLSDSELHRITGAHGDAGKSAREILEGRTKRKPFELVASRDFFDALQRARGPIAKAEILQKQLQGLSALEGQYVVKILTSDLRIGLKEGLMEEAIARAFEAPPG